MKNLLVVGLCAAFTTSALAAQLGIQFDPADPNTNSATLATVPRDGSVEVEITWTQSVSESGIGLAGLSLGLTTVPEDPAPGLQGDVVGDPDLYVPTYGSDVFALGGEAGYVGGFLGEFFRINLASTAAGVLRAPGTTVVGTFVIQVAPDAALGLHPFYILRNPSLALPDVMGWDSVGPVKYAYSSPSTTLGTYDIGSGFAGSNIDVMRSDDSIPLMINVVPEPATFTLLAMGGLAALRRRSTTR